MNEIQLTLINIAKVFRSFCAKHQLRYCIIGGTALGAVRHKGFIPWDDDIDFAMPREDYERFLQLAKELDGQYRLRDYSVDKKGHSFCFAKIDDTHTTLIEQSLSVFQHKGGVYIDIFPLDGTFDCKFLQNIHFFCISKLVRLRELAYIAKIKPEKGFIYNSIIRILRKTCRGDMLYKTINFFLKLKKYNQANFVGNLVWGYGKREIFPKSYYEPFSKIEFENEEFNAPHKINEYLTAIYGDYMTPPPEEKRVSQHPMFYLNLDLPYQDFQYDL